MDEPLKQIKLNKIKIILENILEKKIIDEIEEENKKKISELNRNNKNYLHIKKILNQVKSRNLKVSAFDYLLRERYNYLWNNLYVPDLSSLLHYDKVEYLNRIYFKDSSFSFEDMFIMENHRGTSCDTLMLKNEELSLFPKYFMGEINKKELELKSEKYNKKRAFSFSTTKIFNLFGKKKGDNILLELDLNKPLEDLQEEVKLAKRFFNKNKNQVENEFEINYGYNVFDNELFEELKNKRSVKIPFDEKLIDLLFIIDCLIIDKPNIKLLLQNYYSNNYKEIYLDYLLTDYYKELVKKAKQIINKMIYLIELDC
jgi:hypothetical protein